jgi:hypothetical protein
MVDAGLMTGTGEAADLSNANIPDAHKTAVNAALTSFGVPHDVDKLIGLNFGINFGCIAARIGEAAAVAACATTGNPIVVAACAAAAHALADEACK